MREILFRGQRTYNGEWVYGDLIHECRVGVTILEQEEPFDNFAIFPETIGQYTGMKYKNGDRIYEGDIMRLCYGTYPCLVYWDGRGFAWKRNGKRIDIDLTRERMAIIGNIHDNPELMKGGKDNG